MSSKLHRAMEAVQEAVYEENERGGEARGLLAEIGRLVGVNLGENPLGGQTWDLANMRRVVDAVDGLRRQNAQLRGLPPDGFALGALRESVDFRERGW
ncbi:hypothetical protein [Lentzea sp. NEAU-D7]|uniref:hypothetical protein n=1 Tax=Lentzea sp. NEAU-D7 TaxID=2994667 RepID=UPI00224AD68F|nr:hypothetical protein [Lentzea sp. NEAU-D7]MCX2949905.1 hypothetical protein [Lentzea sp. NEAU-D7]